MSNSRFWFSFFFEFLESRLYTVLYQLIDNITICSLDYLSFVPPPSFSSMVWLAIVVTSACLADLFQFVAGNISALMSSS
jgi:hypothetical protein